MSSVATTRPVNLAQLVGELGTDALSMVDDGIERTITCHDGSVTQAQLQAAVDAHVPRIEPTAEDRRAATQAVASMLVTNRIAADTLTYEESVAVAPIFPVWQPDEAVTVGDLRYYDGHLVECLQAHTTQADWTPPAVPALWRTWRDPNAVTEWVQPTGSTDAYAKGAKVTHNGKTWTSNVDANVWQPPTQWTEVTA